MQLRVKTIVIFLLLSLPPLFLTGGLAYSIAENAIRTGLGSSFQQLAHETIEKVDRSMSEVYQNVHTWSRLGIMQEVITGDIDGSISTHLMELQRENGYFSALFTLNREGKVVAASSPGLIGQDFSQKNLYKNVIVGQGYVEDAHFEELTNGWVVTFSFPIRARFLNNETIGVLSALWKTDELIELTQPDKLLKHPEHPTPLFFLTRRDGLVIAAPESYQKGLFQDNLLKAGLKSASLATHGIEGYLIENTPYFNESLLGYSFSTGYRDYTGLNWAVFAAQDTLTAFSPMKRLNRIIFYMGTLVAIFVIVISLVVSRKMTEPILDIAQVARRVSLGDFSGKAAYTSPDEIGSLAKVFNQMILDLKRQRDQLVDKHYVDSIIANMTNSLIVIDPQGTIKTVNKATFDLLGYGEDELIGRSSETVFPQESTFKQQGEGGLINQGTIRNIETSYTSKTGVAIPVLFSAAIMQNEDRKVEGIICVAQDLTERKNAEETLAEQAIRDSLTGLYNRRHFDHRIKTEIERAKRNKQSLAILLCDLDRFKAINDTYGHQVGDEGLKVVAKSILNSVRGIDLVFRWGGDELMVILPGTDREGARITAERIRRKILETKGEFHNDLDVSTGVAVYPEHGLNEDDLIRIADLALYISKKGGHKVHIGAGEYDLDKKSARVTFRPLVAIQPIVDIRSNQVIGYEALSRDPTGKTGIQDLFKKYEMIGKLNELKCICFQTQLKAAQEARLHRVFINVDFKVLTTIGALPKPPDIDVILEISELEALHDIESRLGVATTWRKAGYKFAIDDFGAGFISFPFIARLIPEYIKVDRQTILQAVSTPQFKKFMAGLIVALQSYTKDGIIAEGIETDEELNVTKEIGVHFVQGYLFGKPLAIDTMSAAA